MHIEVWKGRAHWRWHFKGGNGEIVASAEAYPSKGNAMRAAKNCVKAITNLFPGKPVYWDTEEKGKRTLLRWS